MENGGVFQIFDLKNRIGWGDGFLAALGMTKLQGVQAQAHGPGAVQGGQEGLVFVP